MDVKNKAYCDTQLKAVNVATGYLYRVSCDEPTLCKNMTRLWAYNLALDNPSCDKSADIIKAVEEVFNRLPTYNDVESVTNNCAISFQDVTPVISCANITFTDLSA